MFQELLFDLKYALRSLIRSPGFTVVALVVGPQMSRPATATPPPPVDILRLACVILILATLAVFPLAKRFMSCISM